MHVAHLHLENVRGVGEGEQAIDLDLRGADGRLAGWTVLAGPNGSGKTTLLQALAFGLNQYITLDTAGMSVGAWVHIDHDKGRMECLVIFDPASDLVPSRDETSNWHLSQHDFWDLERYISSLCHNKLSKLTVDWVQPISRKGKEDLRRFYDFPGFASLIEGPGRGWFSAGYGAVRRLSGQSAEATEYTRNQPNVASVLNLFREDAALIETVQWLQKLQFRFLDKQEPSVEELIKGCIELLNDGLLQPGIKVVRVDSVGVWARQGALELSLLQLSAGSRTVAALVLDVVRHMATAYGERLRFDRIDGHVVIPHSGVVLIDEPEQHLHPEWQQRLGFWFKEHFPNIQFIVATHSPFICQAADPGRLIRLNLPGEVPAAIKVDEETSRRVVAGGIDEAVVTALFGLDHPHSEASEAKRERIADLEAKELDDALSEDERLELEGLLDELPSTQSAAVEQVLRRLSRG